eukprot:7429553-Prorocentrum_lima.AAC.1
MSAQGNGPDLTGAQAEALIPHDVLPSGVLFQASKAARRQLLTARMAVPRAWQWYGPLRTTRLDSEATA